MRPNESPFSDRLNGLKSQDQSVPLALAIVTAPPGVGRTVPELVDPMQAAKSTATDASRLTAVCRDRVIASAMGSQAWLCWLGGATRLDDPQRPCGRLGLGSTPGPGRATTDRLRGAGEASAVPHQAPPGSALRVRGAAHRAPGARAVPAVQRASRLRRQAQARARNALRLGIRDSRVSLPPGRAQVPVPA